MPHYDGPAYHEGETPRTSRPNPPEPRTQRQSVRPKSPGVGQHSVDPLAALAIPGSLIRERPQVDYSLIAASLRREPSALFHLATPGDRQLPLVVIRPNARNTRVLHRPILADGADSVIREPFGPSAPAPKHSAAILPTESSLAAVSPVDASADGESQPTPTVQSQASARFTRPAPTPEPKSVTEATLAPESDSNPDLNSEPTPPAVTPTADIPSAPLPEPAPEAPTPMREPITPDFQPASSAPAETAQSRWAKPATPQFDPSLRARSRATLLTANSAAKPEPAPAPTTSQSSHAQLNPQSPTGQSTTIPAQPATNPAPTPRRPQPVPHYATGDRTRPDALYQLPPLSLLANPVSQDVSAQTDWVDAQTDQLDATLAAFNVSAHVVAHTVGPTVTQFQVALDRGVKVNKITNLTDDLKLALAAKDIRIEAPIPGKSTVGIEIPNRHPRPVMLKEVLDSAAFREATSPLTIALGVNLFGQPVVTNIAKMPHGLIAGATGSGKSVFINSLLTSLLYKATPAEVRLLLIDPKAVELAAYNGLPHLVSPVVSDAKAAAAALKWAVDEMENRYQKMAAAGARNLNQFNEMARSHRDFALVMPHIVIIIDELADLMMVAASEVQDDIARITQKARAAGIHLIVATQRPSVDVITGTIKNNIPTRIAFMVASQIDSRTIIDTAGAERLLGRGDMLFLGSGAAQPVRLQGTYLDREIDAVVDFVKRQQPPHYLFQPDSLARQAEAAENQDDLFPAVLEYIAGEAQVSTSKLQRVFGVGYNRAANLIDDLEARHYISPASGSKPRDVYFTQDDLAPADDAADPTAD